MKWVVALSIIVAGLLLIPIVLAGGLIVGSVVGWYFAMAR